MTNKNTQLFHKLSHSSYMFRHYRVIHRQFAVSTLPSYTSMSNAVVGNIIYNYSLYNDQQKHTIISQIITLLLHVSTLSCHPQVVRSQYLAKLHKYVKCIRQ